MPIKPVKKAPKLSNPPAGPVTIADIGFGGDGIVRQDDQIFFVPGTVPGDVVRLSPDSGSHAKIAELVTPGPGRVTPPCPQAGACGGCNLQQIDPDLLDRIKHEWVTTALRHQGLPVDHVAPVHRIAPASRRRADLAARRIGTKVYLGFHGQGSDRIVAIDPCLVLAPALIGALPALRTLVETSLHVDEKADFHLTETSVGLDIVITRRRAPDLGDREQIAALAVEHGWARVSWRPQADKDAEPVTTLLPPVIDFGGVSVPLPAASFLQASIEAENIMAGWVLDALKDCRHVADLFCGLGSFALRLATQRPDRKVFAADANPAAIHALQQGLRQHQLTSRIETQIQDLYRQTPTAETMKKWQGVVFDPPRAGASLVAGALAKSSVPVVVAVSCNPATLARDVRLLVDGGYHLERIHLIDQFLWSSHIEAVAILRR